MSIEATMSEMGHQRRFEQAPGSSVLPPIPDVSLSRGKRRSGPETDFNRRCGTSISNFQFTSASSFVRSLTWIFSSDRTALLMSRPNCAPTWPAVSLSNLALISSQLNGRVGNPG